MAKVLIVEDDPDILGLVRHHLGKAGHQVLTTDSAEGALTLLEEKAPPDVAVLDVSLPGMDGRRLAERMRDDARTEDVRIVFLTASVDPEDIAAAQELSDAYLTKPFVASALLATIAKLSDRGAGEPESW
ncbi:MAG: response regulator [Actinomycetota bacterium]|nr:response regulator [Actinomycetota bacterium]